VSKPISEKVEDAKSQVRKMAADMEILQEDLFAEIRSVIKLSN
jgi:hypothetical protein